jgi:hypothetical protein
MTFEEFLSHVRREIGSYCTDSYWLWKYNTLPDKSAEGIKKVTFLLAVNAIATDYSSTYI